MLLDLDLLDFFLNLGLYDLLRDLVLFDVFLFLGLRDLLLDRDLLAFWDLFLEYVGDLLLDFELLLGDVRPVVLCFDLASVSFGVLLAELAAVNVFSSSLFANFVT